ncbi:MAG: hypothetical protein ACLGIF_01170, partial [Actinomycetes bacterium]
MPSSSLGAGSLPSLGAASLSSEVSDSAPAASLSVVSVPGPSTEAGSPDVASVLSAAESSLASAVVSGALAVLVLAVLVLAALVLAVLVAFGFAFASVDRDTAGFAFFGLFFAALAFAAFFGLAVLVAGFSAEAAGAVASSDEVLVWLESVVSPPALSSPHASTLVRLRP